MSTHDNEPASEDEGQQQSCSEKPKPGKEAKEKAHEIMSAYEDRPTLVLPGSGGAISGTAINDWLDDEGNCKYGKNETTGDDETFKDKIATDKAFNEEVIKAGKDEKAAASK